MIYDMVSEFIGEVPQAFEFVYAIVTLVFAILIVSFLFQVLQIPFRIRGR